MTIQELVIHGWDLRAGFEPLPRLSGACLPVLVDRAMQRFRNIPQLASFRLSMTQPAPVRYRFEVRGAVPGTYDFVVEEAQVHLEPAGSAVANTTFRCETDTFKGSTDPAASSVERLSRPTKAVDTARG